MSETQNIPVADLDKWLLANARTAEILKRRFPNLTVNEVNLLAKEIVMSALTALR